MIIDFQNLNVSQLLPATQFDERVLEFLKLWSSESAVIEVQTSGSTGKPKKLLVSKDQMKSSAKMTGTFLNLRAGQSALLCLPVDFISGMMMIVRAAQQKMILYTAKPSSNPLEKIDSNFDFCAMTPLQVENALSKIHFIKNLIIGGAATSQQLCDKIKQHLAAFDNGNRVYETYGMTETLSHIALKNIYPFEDDYFNLLPNVEIRTDDRGCLQIYAPKITDGWINTNDVVELSGDKKFRFLGRADHVINSGGAKIHPEEIEKILRKYVDHELVVIGMKDEILGERLTLVIEGDDKLQIRECVEGARFDKSYHKPKEIVFVNQIPRTPNGKIARIDTLNMLIKQQLTK